MVIPVQRNPLRKSSNFEKQVLRLLYIAVIVLVELDIQLLWKLNFLTQGFQFFQDVTEISCAQIQTGSQNLVAPEIAFAR